MNAAKIAALIDAGIVDPTHVRGARLESDGGRTRLCSDAGAVPVDVVVDAVLAPPGAIGVVDPLVEQLLDAGHVRVLDGGAASRSTTPQAALARAGRPRRAWPPQAG
jgi:diaminopimelate decarboxylase